MNIDTIIYAVIAVVILMRLWAVFGQRNDEDRERPNPFVTPPPRAQDGKTPIRVEDRAAQSEIPLLLRPHQAAPASLAGGLERIKELDPSFDEKQFLQGARAAFTTIVEDFAKGDLTRIARLLAPPVLARFQDVVEARHKSGQTMDSKVANIREAEVDAAQADGTQALLTVRFVSDQENTLRDSGGQVIGGTADKFEETTDLWVFARDTKSSDPNWILVETKS